MDHYSFTDRRPLRDGWLSWPCNVMFKATGSLTTASLSFTEAAGNWHLTLWNMVILPQCIVWSAQFFSSSYFALPRSWLSFTVVHNVRCVIVYHFTVVFVLLGCVFVCASALVTNRRVYISCKRTCSFVVDKIIWCNPSYARLITLM